MSKELEALNFINNFLISQTTDTPIHKELCNACDLLRTTLKNYEKLNHDYSIVVDEKASMACEYAKKLKALEIIKEKKVDIRYLLDCRFQHYNLLVEEDEELTKEEYDLLKEELL